MKNNISHTKLLLLVFVILFSYSSLKSQSSSNQDSLIRIQKIETLLISNPGPQYIVEIVNNRTISFYNNLPDGFSKNHTGIKGWIVDSITIDIENSDFIELEKTIAGVNLSDLNTLKEKVPINGVYREISGGFIHDYIINLSNQQFEFKTNSNNEERISNSAKSIREIIEKLEEKYKPNN